MKKRLIIIFLLSLAFLTAIVYSVSSISLFTPNLEKVQDCNTAYSNETEDVFDYVTRYQDTFKPCTHANGTRGQCKSGAKLYKNYEKIGSKTVTKSKQECVDKKYRVNVNNKVKEIDLGDMWACINFEENSCLIVQCVHKWDGAYKGKYVDCNGGKTCQRFEFCGTSLRTLYKNSREDFAENDPTFHTGKLVVGEVSQ